MTTKPKKKKPGDREKGQKKGRKAKESPEKRLKKLRKKARLLLKETRKILRRKKRKLSDKIKDEVNQAYQELSRIRKEGSEEALAKPFKNLEVLFEKHLLQYKKSTFREYAESIGIAVAVALFLRAFCVEAFRIPSGSMLPTLKVGDHIFVNKFVYGFRVPFTSKPPKKFWKFRAPKRGEIIVFIYPKDPEHDFIKRVVGIPEDRVKVSQSGQVWIRKKDGKTFVPVKRIKKGKIQFCDLEKNINPINGKVISEEWIIREGMLYNEELGDYKYSTLVTGRSSYRDEQKNELTSNKCKVHLETPKTEGASSATPEEYVICEVPKDHLFVLGDNRSNSEDSRFWGFVPMNNVKGKALITWFSYGGELEDKCKPSVRWSRTLPIPVAIH